MINAGQARAAVAMVIASDGQMSIGEALDRIEQMTGPAVTLYPTPKLVSVVPAPAPAPAAIRVAVAQPGSSTVHAALTTRTGTYILTCGTARGSLAESTDRAVNCPRCLLDLTESLF
jgi:hypothetical protein